MVSHRSRDLTLSKNDHEQRHDQHLKIDFVSDVACPWCVIGLRGLEQALANAADAVEADITFQPFELNPGMPAAGQNLVEHITEKYGSTRSSRPPVAR